MLFPYLLQNTQKLLEQQAVQSPSPNMDITLLSQVDFLFHLCRETPSSCPGWTLACTAAGFWLLPFFITVFALWFHYENTGQVQAKGVQAEVDHSL
jgi:hypothetical protein